MQSPNNSTHRLLVQRMGRGEDVGPEVICFRVRPRSVVHGTAEGDTQAAQAHWTLGTPCTHDKDSNARPSDIDNRQTTKGSPLLLLPDRRQIK